MNPRLARVRSPIAAALAALATLLAGCPDDECADVNCSPCAPQLVTVVVVAPGGGPVAGAAVTGAPAPFTCTQGDTTVCRTSAPVEAGGPLDLTVTAPGYTSQVVRVERQVSSGGACCGDCPGWPPATVTLAPAT